jgi:photosystem II stability/assembly factor-like uncharacterized protein
MNALVETTGGVFSVDLESEEVEPSDEELTPQDEPVLNLPRVVAAAVVGATVFAVVDTRPPIVVSRDGGATWRESGRGLPPGRAIAIAEDDPDTAVFAARNRVYVTRDGGVFWTAVSVELPEIVRVAFSS